MIQTRFGECEYDEEKILTFPHGLMGFEKSHRFMLITISEDSPFLLLQSIDEAHLGLLVANPYSFTDAYIVKISDAEQCMLHATSIEELAVLVTVTAPKDAQGTAVLNLTGPILINHQARIGIQVPQPDGKNPPSLHLQLQKTQKPQEENLAASQDTQHEMTSEERAEAMSKAALGAVIKSTSEAMSKIRGSL